MKLRDLDPSYATSTDGRDRFLILDCPHCRLHQICIQVAGEGKAVWESQGASFDDLTLTPSIQSTPDMPVEQRQKQFVHGYEDKPPFLHCWFHFFIRKGEIEFA